MRLIDVDALLETMENFFTKAEDEARYAGRRDADVTWNDAVYMIKAAPTIEPEQKWIPIKTRPMTDEERDYWSTQYGYDVEYENAVMFDCKMPKDKQAIWVQSKCGYVFEDICENDDGMISLEGNGDWDDIVAWMPKYIPEPYREEGD